MKQLRLTKTMKAHLEWCCELTIREQVYYGNKEQFYKRFDKILKWLKEQKTYRK